MMTGLKTKLYRAKTFMQSLPGWRANRSHWVKNAELRLTWRCNSRCVMCDIWRYTHDHDDALKVKTGLVPLFERELTTEQACLIVDQLIPFGLELFTISGGEPTLRPDLPAIVGHAAAQGVRVHINTNGSTISTELADALIAAGLKQVNLSMDGPTEPVHDAIRGPGMFARSVAGMRALKAAATAQGRPFHLHLHCVVTGSNYRAIEQFLDVQEDWAWDSLSFGPMLHGETDDWQKLNTADRQMPLTAQAIGDLVREIGPRLAARAERLGLAVAGLPFGPTAADWQANAQGIYCEPEQFCTVAWFTTTVQANGDVIPCGYSANDLVLGNLLAEPFDAIYNGEAYSRFRASCKPVSYSMCRSCVLYRDYNAQYALRYRTLKRLGLAGPALGQAH